MSDRKPLWPHPWLSGVMLVIWLLLMKDLSLGVLLLGIVLAWAIPRMTHVFWPNPPGLRHPLVFLRFCARVLWDIAEANVEVARLVYGRSRKLRPAFIEYQLEVKDSFTISLLASTVSLTPGTVSADISDDRCTLLIHVLDLEDEQALVQLIKQRYEWPLKEVFECSTS